MLTNELSISAATLLPALAVRSHRGVTVGRETCSAYHFINALKFVNIILPNSQVRFRLPLVEDVFDTQINDRVPYGRGVLPDYEVPLSFEEVTGTDNDIILDKALELIATNQYINYTDPFIVESDTKPAANGIWKYIFLGAAFIAVIAFLTYILRNKKQKIQHSF